MTGPDGTGGTGGPGGIRVDVVAGVGEVTEGTDLADLLDATALADGDVVVVTSKVVSKAEGRVTDVPREQALAEETVRVVARRGPTSIVRTRHGLVMAAAGIDASNVAPGRLVLLPRDPDASARALRGALAARRGVNVAVVVTDTAGRAWRVGQTDIAVGAAGLVVADDHAGRHDTYGNPLAVTLPAVADEVAGAAELATGKLTMSPVSVVRGLARHVLPAGEDGPGAAALVRGEGEDMFGLGAREAVVTALAGPHPAFGHPVAADDLAPALRSALETLLDGGEAPDLRVARGAVGEVTADLSGLSERDRGRVEVTLGTLAAAHGWRASPGSGTDVVLVPARP